MCPSLNFFDRRGQKFWGKLVLAANLVVTVGYVCFFFPGDEERFVMNAADVRNSLVVNTAVLTVYSSFLIYLNDLVNQTYEEVKTSNEAMAANTREKEEFFATISHEIRNPLQSLQGSVELMAELYKSGSVVPLSQEMPQLLEICKGCCGVVINLVSNVLDMSKIAADRMQLSPVATDLRELARRVLRTGKGRAEGKSVRLELECDPELPPAVEVDPQRIEQVLVNLVSNAIKFTQSKGRIVVKLTWAADSTSVSQTLAHSSWKQVIELAERDHSVLTVTSPHSPNRSTSVCLGGLSDKYSSPSVPSGKRKRKKNSGSPLVVPTPEDQARQKPTNQGIVKIEVMDSGIGISRDGVQKLFRPYQQANSSISRHVLLISRKIIDVTEAPDSVCGSARTFC